jgi:uncharacterized membrane protein
MGVRRYLAAREGGVSIISALSTVAMIGFAGLATDIGSVYLETRRLQGSADLAALAAIENPAQADALARATIFSNHWRGDTQVTVTHGAFNADRSVPVSQRFTANAPETNAVRVKVTSSAPLFFGRLFLPYGRMTIRREATAAQARMAAFQIGSRLLALRGGAANAVLSGLTGSNVNLSVMDYNALLQADVELFSYLEALRARLDLEAASFDRTMSQRLEAAVALDALADTLAAQDSRAERAMRRVAEAAGEAGTLRRFDDLIDLGPYGAQDQTGHTQVRVNALDLASAILQIAGGDRQVRLALGAAAPGLASVTVWLAIGERPNNAPWLAITDDDEVVIRTAQMRLYVEAAVRPGGALGALQMRVPVLMELAAAEARLAGVRCGVLGAQREVMLSVAPSIGTLTLGDIDKARLDDFRTPLRATPAALVRAPAVHAEGYARVELAGREWHDVRFTGAEIDRAVVKTVASRDAARAGVSSLLSETDLEVRVAGLGLGLTPVTSALHAALGAAAAPLDDVINGLTDLLGVRLGEADVRVNGVRCGGAALVA